MAPEVGGSNPLTYPICTSGAIGRRTRLSPWAARLCGFKSHLVHHFELKLYLNDNITRACYNAFEIKGKENSHAADHDKDVRILLLRLSEIYRRYIWHAHIQRDGTGVVPDGSLCSLRSSVGGMPTGDFLFGKE